MIDNEKFNNAIEKMKVYNSSESVSGDEIKNILLSMKYYYDSANNQEVEDLMNKINQNFVVQINNYKNVLSIFEKKLLDYNIALKKGEKLFENLNDSII